MAYSNRFIHHVSWKLPPLYELKTYRTTKSFCEHWTEQHNKAFGIAKLATAGATMFAHHVIRQTWDGEMPRISLLAQSLCRKDCGAP